MFSPLSWQWFFSSFRCFIHSTISNCRLYWNVSFIHVYTVQWHVQWTVALLGKIWKLHLYHIKVIQKFFWCFHCIQYLFWCLCLYIPYPYPSSRRTPTTKTISTEYGYVFLVRSQFILYQKLLCFARKTFLYENCLLVLWKLLM